MSSVKLHKVGVATPKSVDRTSTPAKPAKGNPAGDHVVHGELPKAPKLNSAVRFNRFGTAAQAMGKDPVNAVMARLAGMSDSEAAEFLGKVFAESIKGIA